MRDKPAKEWLTIHQIYLIWIGLTCASCIAGCFILPWYSVQEETGWTADTKYETLYHVIKNKKGILEPTEDSIKQQFIKNIRYLKSPMIFGKA